MNKILDKIKKYGKSLTSMFEVRDDGEYVPWLDPESQEGQALLKDTQNALKGKLEPANDELDEKSKKVLLEAQNEVNELAQRRDTGNAGKNTRKLGGKIAFKPVRGASPKDVSEKLEVHQDRASDEDITN